MILKLNRLCDDRTVRFAAGELADYLHRMDSSLEILFDEEKTADAVIHVGINARYDEFLPAVANKKLDDAVHIDVENLSGVITGTNPRSVLIAVYRFLRELGCRFIRPGRDNEVVPACDLSAASVHVTEAASYRHRENCIEGVVSYEHVSDMIDWMPKVGMNSYFMQFIKPFGYFRLWYDHASNPYMEDDTRSDAELEEMFAKLEDQIAERGMTLAQPGHSWTCESLGVDGSYWYKKAEPAPPEISKYLAMIDGKRDWFRGVPINTQLCYSSTEVREKMTDFMLEYAKTHPNVKNLVFWLADNYRNNCQCENCRRENLADLYIKMINLLDDKLTASGLDTRIVFFTHSFYYYPDEELVGKKDLLVYHALPEKEKLHKNDRIVMMPCPIFRDFSQTYPESVDDAYLEGTPEFKKGDIINLDRGLRDMPNVVAWLRKWQEVYDGDSILYDYLLIWFCNHDPSSMVCAEHIASDMRNLKNIGLGGISSCQSQRCFFPTGLAMAAMAETLWNREKSFDEIKTEYLTGAFGADGERVGELLSKLSIPELSHIMSTVEALDWEKTANDETRAAIRATYPVIEELRRLIAKNLADGSHPDAVAKSWEYLDYYPEFATLYMDTWMASYGENDVPKTRRCAVKLVDYVNRCEPQLHRVFDALLLKRRIYSFFNSAKLPGTVIDAV